MAPRHSPVIGQDLLRHESVRRPLVVGKDRQGRRVDVDADGRVPFLVPDVVHVVGTEAAMRARTEAVGLNRDVIAGTKILPETA